VRIASLHVYPVKGARGTTLEHAELFASGIRNDRRFMVIGADGAFVTQRRHPSMALVDVAIAGDHMTVAVAGMTASVALAPLHLQRPRCRVRIWDDEVDAVDVGGEGAELFSDYLGERCSLVFMPPDVIRPVKAPYGRTNDRVGFADGFPVLVASLSSLADLNARLQQNGMEPVPMDRFRPSIVVEGGEPFAEDKAPMAHFGSVVLRMPKRCGRCQVTTVDQMTGATSKEPLRTLASYRTDANKVNFGMNAIPDLATDASAVIHVGDTVRYVE
jgi:uncharacterized protein YcbX